MARADQQEFIQLDAIVLKACQPDLTQRYQTTDLMLKELQAASQM